MTESKKVVIAGGTGFVGGHLVKEFNDAGYDVVVLSRSGKAPSGARGMTWNSEIGPWVQELEGAKAVINLVGEPIATRWTEEAKKAILESRTKSTSTIAAAIAGATRPPEVWLNASAVGIYGDTGSREVTEATAPGKGFAAEVGEAWEAATESTPTPETRKVIVRISTVLGKDGGALPKLAKVANLGLGGALGDGRQFVSWIHIADLVGMMRWAIESPDVHGVLNGSSPYPVTNDVLMAQLREVYGRPPVPKVPAFMFKIVSNIIGVPAELLLTGQRVLPTIPLGHGFEFMHPHISGALHDLLDEKPKAWDNSQKSASMS